MEPRDRIDKLIRRVWVFAIVANTVIVVAGSLWVQDVTSRIERGAATASKHLERAEFATCRRVQRIRMNANRNSAVLYQGIWTLTGSTGVPPSVKRQLRVLTDVPQYQGPTNCTQAVQHPETYRPPVSVSVSRLSLSKRRELLSYGR